jgi:hypothetical protein
VRQQGCSGVEQKTIVYDDGAVVALAREGRAGAQKGEFQAIEISGVR